MLRIKTLVHSAPNEKHISLKYLEIVTNCSYYRLSEMFQKVRFSKAKVMFHIPMQGRH